jgi:hypothetical protein
LQELTTGGWLAIKGAVTDWSQFGFIHVNAQFGFRSLTMRPTVSCGFCASGTARYFSDGKA